MDYGNRDRDVLSANEYDYVKEAVVPLLRVALQIGDSSLLREALSDLLDPMNSPSKALDASLSSLSSAISAEKREIRKSQLDRSLSDSERLALDKRLSDVQKTIREVSSEAASAIESFYDKTLSQEEASRKIASSFDRGAKELAGGAEGSPLKDRRLGFPSFKEHGL